ncbi:NACHT and ankyrin domain-containing protein [Colletotrichum musicola]|uniref:NACHT and ankyrin domain-containing protein n=1 Tax=Colletotrichum musicola TaxID=2175873 RepID=A0A8H6K382_9PEZI|nr:NACHT and ankyrin domain-containing protein [Colletotrichum musicola]
MDGACPLPLEIVRLILLEAVRARGMKRALRLRFVSRSWNHEVMQAIVESGIYDPDPRVHSWRNVLWPVLLMHKLGQADAMLSRPLRVIRRVARDIVTSRGGGDDNDEAAVDPEALQACLWEISRQSVNANRFPWHLEWFQQHQKPVPVLDSDDDYRMALIAGAIITNDLAIVKELLPSTDACLLYQTGWDEPEPVLGLPLDVAAHLGREEALRMILDTIRNPHDLDGARIDAVGYAVDGDQPGTLKQCLDPVYHFEEMAQLYEDFLLRAVNNPDSLEVVDRIYKMCKGNMVAPVTLGGVWGPPRQPPPGDPQAQLRFQGDWFDMAVCLGDLRAMKHVQKLGLPPGCFDGTRVDLEDERYCRTQVSNAARGGHMEVVVYLLEHGEPIGSRSLEAASEHGNPDIVRLLLERGARDTFKPGSALVAAVKREHTKVVRLLMESEGGLVDEDATQQAMKVAEEQGLSSMAELLKE